MCLLWGIANSHHDPVHNPTLARQVREDSSINWQVPRHRLRPTAFTVLCCMSKFNPIEVLFLLMVYSMRSKRGALCAQGKLSVAAARQARTVRFERERRVRTPDRIGKT
jgi:hypothetical protein